jgi:hypothetical protein
MLLMRRGLRCLAAVRATVSMAVDTGQWVKIKDYPIPPSLPWNRQTTDVCFQIPSGYPGTPPYGFYVAAGILYNGNPPDSYREPAQNSPPFQGV